MQISRQSLNGFATVRRLNSHVQYGNNAIFGRPKLKEPVNGKGEAISKDMRAKLDGIKAEMRIGISPSMMAEAKSCLRQMVETTKFYAEKKKGIAADLKEVMEEKDKLSDIISGKGDPDFYDITAEHARNLIYGKSVNELADNNDLTKLEKSAAYKLYGNEYLKGRSDFLQEKVDFIRTYIKESDEMYNVNCSFMKTDFYLKFGDNAELNELMEKLQPIEEMFTDTNAENLLGALEASISAFEAHIKSSEELLADFEKNYNSSFNSKVYA